MKTRHQLAFAEVEKLRKSLQSSSKSEDNGEDSDELEMKASSILMASFCEDFPKDAVPEISLDDQLPISLHIERVTTEYAKRQGVTTLPKKRRPGPVIR